MRVCVCVYTVQRRRKTYEIARRMEHAPKPQRTAAASEAAAATAAATAKVGCHKHTSRVTDQRRADTTFDKNDNHSTCNGSTFVFRAAEPDDDDAASIC